MLRSRFSPSAYCIAISTPLSLFCRHQSSKSFNNNNNNNDSNDDIATTIVKHIHHNSSTSHEERSLSNRARNSDAASASQSSSGGLMDPSTAYVARLSQRAVDGGQMTPEARLYYQRLHANLGDKAAPMMDKMRELLGEEDPRNLTQHQRNVYATVVTQHANAVFSKHTRDLLNEHKGMKEFADSGAPTGENYWFEAGGTLTAPDLPREMKDDLFDEMKRNRPEGSNATKDTGF